MLYRKHCKEGIYQKIWRMVIDFFDLAEEGKWVSLIALYTKENTGKELPGVKLKFDRPIGISDEHWRRLYNKYSNPYYGYIDP